MSSGGGNGPHDWETERTENLFLSPRPLSHSDFPKLKITSDCRNQLFRQYGTTHRWPDRIPDGLPVRVSIPMRLMDAPFWLEQHPNPCHTPTMLLADKYQQNALTTALLMDAGIELMRENIRRRTPAANGPKADKLLGAWLHRQNDPIPGDTAGNVRIREQNP